MDFVLFYRKQQRITTGFDIMRLLFLYCQKILRYFRRHMLKKEQVYACLQALILFLQIFFVSDFPSCRGCKCQPRAQ